MKENNKEGTRLSKTHSSATNSNHIGIIIIFCIECVGNAWFLIVRANKSLPN